WPTRPNPSSRLGKTKSHLSSSPPRRGATTPHHTAAPQALINSLVNLPLTVAVAAAQIWSVCHGYCCLETRDFRLLGIMDSFHPGPSSQLDATHEKGADEGFWYFSRKEIEENSPSRRDGIDLKKETYYRKSYCTFLQDLGMRLKVPQVTIATAIIFCHRYYLRQSHAKNDRRTVATACMFVAGKVEETPRPLKDVILVSYDIIHKKDPDVALRIKQKEVYEQHKELVVMAERVVLATLDFDLNVFHPYKPLVEAIRKFGVAQHALAQVAWNFVNDGLRTSLSLQFKPQHIAAGAIFLAAKFLKVKLPSDGEKVWWQEFNVNPRQLEEISNQMLEQYEQNRVPLSHGSEAEGTAGGTCNRAASNLSTEDRPASNKQSQDGSGIKLEPSSAPSTQLNPDQGDSYGAPSRINHNQGSDAVNEVKNGSELTKYVESSRVDAPSQHGNVGDERNTELHSGEDKKDTSVSGITDEGGESKDRLQNLSVEHKEPVMTHSPLDIIKTIDEDKLKELREKRKRSRGDVIKRKDNLDEFDPIVKELEEGVELAVAEREKTSQEKKRSWSQASSKLENVDSLSRKHTEAIAVDARGSKRRHEPDADVEEGEVSAMKKRKVGSPS
ncbi:Cyclin-T1-5-like protein, partial [Drosera capensis]